MNVFFSADWETTTAASDTDTERGNEGPRKGEIYATAEERTKMGEIQVTCGSVRTCYFLVLKLYLWNCNLVLPNHLTSSLEFGSCLSFVWLLYTLVWLIDG